MLPYFYSLNEYLKDKFGTKVYKLALDGGMTCPNRDGHLDTRGCIFCSAGGSGDFAGNRRESVTDQIEHGKKLVEGKYKGNSYIAYFQAFTNTYAPVDYLRKIFTEAIQHPDIVCLSIATRPDCLGDEIIELLASLNKIKPVWVELGLQTIHESTARYIRRGYSLPVFEEGVHKLRTHGIETIVHMILGLPGECAADMYATAAYLARADIQGIKLQAPCTFCRVPILLLTITTICSRHLTWTLIYRFLEIFLKCCHPTWSFTELPETGQKTN